MRQTKNSYFIDGNKKERGNEEKKKMLQMELISKMLY